MGLQNVNTMNKLNCTLTLFFLGICFLTPLSSQTPTASFATWKDNKRAAYSIIHDDYSDYVTGIFQYADPIATARGIKLCFGAITSACGPLEWLMHSCPCDIIVFAFAHSKGPQALVIAPKHNLMPRAVAIGSAY